MMELMLNTVKTVIIDVLNTLYQQFWLSIVLAVLCMFLVIYARDKGWKNVFVEWINTFKTDNIFRRYFLLVFYVAMIMLRTVLNRSIWKNPLENVIGTWGLFYPDGSIATEGIQNLVLFVPFTILFLWSMSNKIFSEKVSLILSVRKSLKISFLLVLGIELLQLFFRLGTFQLSDIFYNTLGGLIGGIIYYIIYKIKHRKK